MLRGRIGRIHALMIKAAWLRCRKKTCLAIDKKPKFSCYNMFMGFSSMARHSHLASRIILRLIFSNAFGLMFKVLFTKDNRDRTLVAKFAKLKKL